MASNQYPGTCYRCTKWVAKGEGYFERARKIGWRVQHTICAITGRDMKNRVFKQEPEE